MSLNPKILEFLKIAPRDQRLYIFEREPIYFYIYYLYEYFTYHIPDFHFDLYDDVKRLVAGELDEAAWIVFREGAKTSLAKYALILWCIVFRKKRYINVDSYDKANAESALFDVVSALRTNRKIIADFGELYTKRRRNIQEEDDEPRLKRISSFITENKIKVEAFSTQESTRGRVYGRFRPDLYILDDIENSITKESYPITRKIIAHIDELKAGAGPNAAILYLGNYITEEGVIAHVTEILRQNPRSIVRNIPVVNNQGIIAWPDKYVRTDAEAAEANKGKTMQELHKISLEAKERQLTSPVFQTEMMNNPAGSGDLYFDRPTILRLREKAEEPIEVIAGLKLWQRYTARHRYSMGADSAEGVGLDSSAVAVIDLTSKPALVVATYEDNRIDQIGFAHEIMRTGNLFGQCFAVPEVNNGYAVVAEMIREEKDEKGIIVRRAYPSMYIRQQKDKTTGKTLNYYGFKTTMATKPEILSNFKVAVEDGDLLVLDKGLLEEIMYYKKIDLRLVKAEEGATRHFDKLMAAALAWEGRFQAPAPKPEKEYRQEPYKPGKYG